MNDPEFQRWVDVVLAALAVPPIPLAGADKHVRRHPGLYAISGLAGVWLELGLGEPADQRPLYVGKSESDLASRVLTYHFGYAGRTGWSSPRRSSQPSCMARSGCAAYRVRRTIRATTAASGSLTTPTTATRSSQGGCAIACGSQSGRLRLAVWPLAEECPYKLEDLEKNVVR